MSEQDLTPAYEALQKAHEAGDTKSAQKLADYIRGEQAKLDTGRAEPIGVAGADSAAEAISSWFKPQEQKDIAPQEVAGAAAGGAAAGAAAGAILPGALRTAGKFIPGWPGKALQGLGEGMSALPVKERMIRGAGGGAAMGVAEKTGEAFGAPKAVTFGASMLAGGVGEASASFLGKETSQLLRFVGNLAYANVSGASRAVAGMLSPNKALNEATAAKLQQKLFGNPTGTYVNELVSSDNRIAAQEALRKADPSLNSGPWKRPEQPKAPWETSDGEMGSRQWTSEGAGASTPGPKRTPSTAAEAKAEAASSDPKSLEDGSWYEKWLARKRAEPTGGGFAGTTERVGMRERLTGKAAPGSEVATYIRPMSAEELKALPPAERAKAIEMRAQAQKTSQEQLRLGRSQGGAIADPLRGVPNQSKLQPPKADAPQKDWDAYNKAKAAAVARGEGRREAEAKAAEQAAEQSLKPASQIYRERMYAGVTDAVRSGKGFSTTPEFEAFGKKLKVQVELGNVSRGEAEALMKTLRADRSATPQVRSLYAETVDNRIRQWGKAAERGPSSGAAAVDAKVSEGVREDLRQAYNQYTTRLGLGDIEAKYRNAYSKEMVAQAKDELPHFLYGFGSGKELAQMARNLAKDPQGLPFIQQAMSKHLAEQAPKDVVREFERLQGVLVDSKLLEPKDLKGLREAAAIVKKTADSGPQLKRAQTLKNMVLLAMTRQAGVSAGAGIGAQGQDGAE